MTVTHNLNRQQTRTSNILRKDVTLISIQNSGEGQDVELRKKRGPFYYIYHLTFHCNHNELWLQDVSIEVH